MRKVVGARRSQIAGQFLGESILQSGLSHLLALAIAGLSLPHLSSWMGVTVTIEHPGWLWILILPTSVLITGVLAGMCPAFIISNFNPVAAVKADRVTGAGGVSLRRVLVVFQFSLSVLLIAGTWVVISQWRFMVAKDPGYNRENVVTLPYPVGDPEAVRQQFLANPKIMHASVTNNAPIRASYFSLRPEGWAEDWNVHFFDLDVDLLNVFGFELLEGSDYSDSRDGRGFILNEAAVKALGWEAPIGKTIMWEIYPMTVIGVVKDFHFESLRERIKPLVLGRIGNRIHLVLRVDSGDLAETMAFIGKTWKGLRPDRPYSYRFLDEQIERLYRRDMRAGQAFLVAALLAVVLASLGLVGLAAFSAEQRTREIGIRKVLGASWPGLVALFTQDFVKLVVLANLLMILPSVYLSHKWLEEFAYRVEPGPWPYLCSGLLSILIATVTVGVATCRSTMADPIDALLHD